MEIELNMEDRVEVAAACFVLSDTLRKQVRTATDYKGEPRWWATPADIAAIEKRIAILERIAHSMLAANDKEINEHEETDQPRE